MLNEHFVKSQGALSLTELQGVVIDKGCTFCYLHFTNGELTNLVLARESASVSDAAFVNKLKREGWWKKDDESYVKISTVRDPEAIARMANEIAHHIGAAESLVIRELK